MNEAEKKELDLNSELQVSKILNAEEEEKKEEKDQHRQKQIGKWVGLSIVFAIILAMVIIGIYYAAKALGGAVSAGKSGFYKATNNATNVADAGVDVAAAAGGVYAANYFFGEYIEKAGTYIYDMIFGTKTASGAAGDAASDASAAGDAAKGGVVDSANVAELAEDAVKVAA